MRFMSYAGMKDILRLTHPPTNCVGTVEENKNVGSEAKKLLIIAELLVTAKKQRCG